MAKKLKFLLIILQFNYIIFYMIFIVGLLCGNLCKVTKNSIIDIKHWI